MNVKALTKINSLSKVSSGLQRVLQHCRKCCEAPLSPSCSAPAGTHMPPGVTDVTCTQMSHSQKWPAVHHACTSMKGGSEGKLWVGQWAVSGWEGGQEAGRSCKSTCWILSCIFQPALILPLLVYASYIVVVGPRSPASRQKTYQRIGLVDLLVILPAIVCRAHSVGCGCNLHPTAWQEMGLGQKSFHFSGLSLENCYWASRDMFKEAVSLRKSCFNTFCYGIFVLLHLIVQKL